MLAKRTDVLVVGAGPGGSSAAIEATRLTSDASVTVIEQAERGRDKVCGDALGPSAVAAVESIASLPSMRSATDVSRVSLAAPSGLEVSADLSSVAKCPGMVIRRAILDRELQEAAQDLGANFLYETELVGLHASGAGMDAIVRGPDGEHTIKAKAVIGADGAYSRTRRLLRIREPRKRYLGVAIRGYAAPGMNSDPSLIRLDYEADLLPAYGWAFPTADGAVNVGLGITLGALQRDKTDLRSHLERYGDRLAERGLVDGPLGDVRAHRLIHGMGQRQLGRGRVLLVGDAGAMMNSLTGEGIYYAVESGRYAAQVLATGATTPAEQYTSTLVRRWRGHMLSNWIALQLMGRPNWAEAAIRAADGDVELQRDAVDLMFGEGSIRPGAGIAILKEAFR